MPKYEVEITRVRTSIAAITLDAEDEQEAEQQALKLADEEADKPETEHTLLWGEDEEYFEIESSDEVNANGEDEEEDEEDDDEEENKEKK